MSTEDCKGKNKYSRYLRKATYNLLNKWQGEESLLDYENKSITHENARVENLLGESFLSPVKAQLGAKEASEELAGIIRSHVTAPKSMSLDKITKNTLNEKKAEGTNQQDSSQAENDIEAKREKLWREFFEKTWRYGDKFDIYDGQLDKWYVCRVYDLLYERKNEPNTKFSTFLGKSSNELRKQKANKNLAERDVLSKEKDLILKGYTCVKLKIQYHGWQKKWDAWVDVPSCENIQNGLKAGPLHMFTSPPKRKARANRSFMLCEETNEKPKLYWDVWLNGTRGGRKRRIENVPPDFSRTGKKAKKQKVLESEINQNDWLCAICNEIQFDRNYIHGKDCILLECDGICLQSFHLKCLGLSKTPVTAKWKCPQCKRRKHCCALCWTSDDDDNLIQCKSPGCAKFFHVNCLKTHMKHTGQGFGQDEKIFRCPLHFCVVCKSFETKKRAVCKCLCCFNVFHLSKCMLPGTRYNKYGAICPSHPEQKLPYIQDDENLVRPVVRNMHIKEIFDVNENIPTRKPLISNSSEANHFRLPNDLLLHSTRMVPEFINLKRCVYEVCKPIKHMDEFDYDTLCPCTAKCGSKCPNRILRLECCSRLCGVGGNCGNRKFGKREYKTVLPFPTPGKGWGLKIMESVNQGEFILEYIGEVLDEETAAKRLQEEASDRHFYQMELEPNRIVDAKSMGNVSRFINHSCTPNIEVQKWCVNGIFRLGFFALRDLKVGEELSYDYKFFSSDKSIICNCGSKDCRGTLRTISQKTKKAQEVEETRKAQKKKILLHSTDGKLTKRMLKQILNETNEEKKERLERHRRVQSQSLNRLSLTSSTVPGDLTRCIHMGASIFCKQRTNKSKVFMWRNVLQGGNFIERSSLLCLKPL